MTEKSELTISKFIEAPPAKVWKAWSSPEHLAQWWIPKPIECRVVKLDLKAGGGFETLMREQGSEFKPHVEACFLEVMPEQRMVWTTTLAEGWQPIEPWLALTAIITFEPQSTGTLYSARVLHKTAADGLKHEQLGFQEGWGTTLTQLAAFAQRL
ncbi:SRPBCC domain-containing protein [Pseudorhizobium marinum]|uniref:SRPBCC domain-containing protein n=1 Tax=Pseudorhizobium marinum TaxID=1496690 RepID=UPI000495554A|nr:SRPBCC domain-containing protein [Pseudorhizobium marinum]MDY6960763.1 SRPBCC domain-containing protein [Pseudomonadota bacterium]